MVGHSSLLVGNLKKYAQGFLPEKLPQQDHTTTTDSEMEEPYLQGSVPDPECRGFGWGGAGHQQGWKVLSCCPRRVLEPEIM